MPEMLQLSSTEVLYVLPRGGASFKRAFTRLNESSLPELDACAQRWPQENRAVVNLIRTQMKAQPQSAHWLACETAFFADLPAATAEYALPAVLSEQGLRRYGADGIFHSWVAHQFAQEERLVSIHLAAHTTLAAIRTGQALDASAGYSLLEGLPGLTTCGDIDPSLVLLLAEQGLATDEIARMLYRQSGWQALAKKEFPLAELISGKEPGLEVARAMFFAGLVKGIGAALTVLGGADLIVCGAEEITLSDGLTKQIGRHFAFAGIKTQSAQVERGRILREAFSQRNMD